MENAQVSVSVKTLSVPARVPTVESAPTLLSTDLREVLACPHCRLVQYRTRNSHCRRCHKSFDATEEECSNFEETGASETPVPPDPFEAVHGLGKKIRSLRKGLGLTQSVFAQRMGLPRTYASKVESGHTTPNLDTLQRIAAALEVEIRDLLCDARSRREEDIEAIFADELAREIAGYLPQLNSLSRALILRAVRDAATDRPHSS
ncbi:MAG TPA: helix-turn-helix transcriptional regulator [Candidatus Binatia bacterium]|nr:helix-turn-helix transcriptional regulator [Candidatus Binatia bacterium]